MVDLNYRERLRDTIAGHNQALSFLEGALRFNREVARIRTQILEPSADGGVRRKGYLPGSAFLFDLRGDVLNSYVLG
jgi:hypothetical protein